MKLHGWLWLYRLLTPWRGITSRQRLRGSGAHPVSWRMAALVTLVALIAVWLYTLLVLALYEWR